MLDTRYRHISIYTTRNVLVSVLAGKNNESIRAFQENLIIANEVGGLELIALAHLNIGVMIYIDALTTNSSNVNRQREQAEKHILKSLILDQEYAELCIYGCVNC